MRSLLFVGFAALIGACAAPRHEALPTDTRPIQPAERTSAQVRWGPDAFGGPTRELAEGAELRALSDALRRFTADLPVLPVVADRVSTCVHSISSYVCLISANVHGYLVTFVENGACGERGLDGDHLYAYDRRGEFVP